MQPPPPPPPFHFPPLQSFDHYLGRAFPFTFHSRCPLSHALTDLLLPSHLVAAALFIRARRCQTPPPLPLPSPSPLPPFTFTQLHYHPLHLQRFLRGLVLQTAHALAIPPPAPPTATAQQYVRARTTDR